MSIVVCGRLSGVGKKEKRGKSLLQSIDTKATTSVGLWRRTWYRWIVIVSGLSLLALTINYVTEETPDTGSGRSKNQRQK